MKIVKISSNLSEVKLKDLNPIAGLSSIF